MNNKKIVEFRGVDKLMIAEVLCDDNETSGTENEYGYATETPVELAPVAEISKTVSSGSESKFYDNIPAMTINSEGADEITFTVPALPLAMLGKILGKKVDETTGAFLDGARAEKYYAVGYRLKLTDGTYRYVWRYKGSFSIPDETSATEDDGTTSNNQSLTFTGIYTTHEFTKGGKAKGLVVDERDGLADVSTFFDTVTTADTLKAKSSS